MAVTTVAILMTLEGEYYAATARLEAIETACRNPHDIGRRILRDRTLDDVNTVLGRNPHDIGRRILLIESALNGYGSIVAILMTLEGEYYLKDCEPLRWLQYGRNPHDIGRRILRKTL